MAMYDWNGDGKKDGVDNFIEYQIYKDVTGNCNTPSNQDSRNSSERKGDISTLGLILCIISGFVLQALVYMVLGVEVENVPVPVIYILWFVCTGVIVGAVGAINKLSLK